LRSQRSDVLLSLAVNANVRQGDQEKALDLLRAGLRAQAERLPARAARLLPRALGHAEEARAILAEVEGTPALYYNWPARTRCSATRSSRSTTSRASSRRTTPASARARSRPTGAHDPDLASLRSHPRFERLLSGG
jgi:uncharacterized protein (DUF2267 family)